MRTRVEAGANCFAADVLSRYWRWRWLLGRGCLSLDRVEFSLNLLGFLPDLLFDSLDQIEERLELAGLCVLVGHEATIHLSLRSG